MHSYALSAIDVDPNNLTVNNDYTDSAPPVTETAETAFQAVGNALPW